jgi:hypothetical protein
MANTTDRFKFLWEIVKGIAVGIAALYSFWANQQSASNAAALEKLRLDASTRAQQSELDLKVYDLVEKALTLEGPTARSHGLAAAALINALTVAPLRGELLSALRAGSTDPELNKQLDDALQFDAADDPGLSSEPSAGANRGSAVDRELDAIGRLFVAPVVAQGLPGALKGYRIDIFFCEARSAAVTDARKKRAQAAADRLKPVGTDIVVRVRNLPLLVQARPGYKSVDDEIRFNTQGNGREAAALLAMLLGTAPQHVHPTALETPNYLSVFYCAG